MDSLLLKRIVDDYKIDGQLKDASTIEGYPHIETLSFNDKFVLKKINRLYCKDIKTLYNYLSQSSYVEIPLQTINDDYGIIYENDVYVLYRFLKEIDESVNPIWWARALESVHRIQVDESQFDSKYNIDKECFSLLKSADSLFDNNLRKCIQKLIDTFYYDVLPNKMVLSHGDPYDRNVMVDGKEKKLIDMESSLLLPREFDIQRLFHNIVIKDNDFSQIDDYFQKFLENYSEKINYKFLKNIYVLDLLRTFSWLNLVTKDSSRSDYERQIQELKKYRESILEERHNKVLKRL